MKVVLPSQIENPTTAEEIAAQALRDSYTELFEEFQGDYAELFAAQEPAVVVEDLVSFFRGLDIVTTLHDPNNAIPDGMVLPQGMARPSLPKSKFFRIPLDEPHFTIDTDTRAITVPAAFMNNGIGVKGDANAEIVFFECPRLFDSVDLYSMVKDGNCYVQWTNTSARVSGNSQVLLCDTTQTTMYLGWMITSAMTTVSGVVEFSVRFFQTEGTGDNQKIVYSLSTQKASCQIKQTMDLDLKDLAAESMEDLVYTRPIYAHVVNSMEGLSPRILEQLVSGNYNLEEVPEDLAEDYPVATYPDGVYVFEVSAESPDGKRIVYQWYKNAEALPGATDASYVAVKPGTYHVVIGNGDASGYRYVTSPMVVVPTPDQIQYVNIVLNKYFGYGVFSADNLVLSTDVTTVGNEAPNGTVQFVWQRANMLDANNKPIPFANITDASYVNIKTENLTAAEGETVITSTYTPATDEEGWYRCIATNKLNNESSKSIKTEKVATVRALPTKPDKVKIKYDANSKTIQIDDTDGPGVIYNNNVPSKYRSGEWRYQWNDGSDISASQGGMGIGDGYKMLRITYPETSRDIFYQVKVSHIIYDGDRVDSTAAASTAKSKESSAQPSNTIVLHFEYRAGADLPDVTVVSSGE